MATYNVIFSGNMVRYEKSGGGFDVMKFSPFNKRGKLPREEHIFSSLADIKAGLRAYSERMKIFCQTDDLIGLASEEEDAPLNGTKVYAHLAKGQRKPNGWGKNDGLSLRHEFAAEPVETAN